MKPSQNHISLNPEEIIKKTAGIQKCKNARAISYGLIGKKDNHLYVYELSQENTPNSEVKTYKLLIVDIDLDTHKSTVRHDMCAASADRQSMVNSIKQMKTTYAAQPTQNITPQPATQKGEQ